MLSEIRERATGWIAYIIVGIIIIPFAFWGVNEYFAGGEEVVVATVGDAEIEQVGYRRALENRRAQMRRVLGDNFSPEIANSPEFKRGVLNDLISRTLLDQHAEEQGYRVGDELLARQIRINPRFQVDGEFSPDAYRGAVAQMGLTQTGFEARLRRQLVLQQLRDGIQQTAFTTPDQRDGLLRLSLQERRFDHAVLQADRFVDDVEVTDDEVRDEYEANPDRYRTAERLKVEYVELSVDELAASINVSDEELRQAYEQNESRFTSEAVRHASHILIETGSDPNEDERRGALDEANKLMERLRSGADFAGLAKQHSDDPGSAAQGGDLGRIEKGAMVAPFEEALFELTEEGALAGPVRTRFGYHIIKLTGYQPAEVEPFAEVRDELLIEERRRQAEALFLDRAEAFRNIAYEHPQSLEPVADQLELTIQQSGWFTRESGSGIAADPDVREAAFSEDVFQERLNSEAIELDINTLVVVRRLDHQPANVKPLDQVRDGISNRLRRQKARERAAEIGPRIVEQLESGKGWQAVVAEHELAPETVRWSRNRARGQNAPAAEVIDAVFRLPKPAGEEAAVPGGLALPGGDYALFRLVEVIEVEVDQAPEDLKQRVSRSLQGRRGQDMVEQYIAELREKAEVTIKDEAL